MLQPLGVSRENGGFRVVYGSRRRAAAIQVGLPEVPCVVVDASPEDRLIHQMLENLQRRDLNDMDKAEGFARLRRNLARQHPDWSDRQLDDADRPGSSGSRPRPCGATSACATWRPPSAT